MKTELTKDEFERLTGFKIEDWQWEWIKAFANGEKKIQWVQGRRGGRYVIIEKAFGESVAVTDG